VTCNSRQSGSDLARELKEASCGRCAGRVFPQRRRGGAAFGLGVGREPVAIQSQASLVTRPVPQPLCFLRQYLARCGLKKRIGPQELGQKAMGSTCNIRQPGSDLAREVKEAGLTASLVKCRMSRVEPVAPLTP
jgi:hypothetical protein